MSFEDHFSQRAQEYAQYRPSYPSRLFAYLSSLAPSRHLAWDCGTGNGQAALGLAEYFDHVVATDASSNQIAQAFPHERIEYRVEPAEEVSLDAGSVDLITVAIAVHWFDFERFYREVRRVLQAGGILAVWTYHLPVIGPRVDPLLVAYYREILAGYWPERFSYVDDRYRTLPFPFEEVDSPEFDMTATWTLGQLVGFLGSWSAARKYQEDHNRHPVQEIWPKLVDAWGEPDQSRSIRWPMYIRVGRAT